MKVDAIGTSRRAAPDALPRVRTATPANVALRAAYCLALVSIVLPFAVNVKSWWSLPHAGPAGAAPMLLLAFAAFLPICRIYQVLFVPGTLTSYAPMGFARVLRFLGVLAISVGAFASVAPFVMRPLVRALTAAPSDSGVGYFVAGIFVLMLGGLGPSGVLLYELSRMMGFERVHGGRTA